MLILTNIYINEKSLKTVEVLFPRHSFLNKTKIQGGSHYIHF